jgi:hypothetical protein
MKPWVNDSTEKTKFTGGTSRTKIIEGVYIVLDSKGTRNFASFIQSEKGLRGWWGLNRTVNSFRPVTNRARARAGMDAEKRTEEAQNGSSFRPQDKIGQKEMLYSDTRLNVCQSQHANRSTRLRNFLPGNLPPVGIIPVKLAPHRV